MNNSLQIPNSLSYFYLVCIACVIAIVAYMPFSDFYCGIIIMFVWDLGVFENLPSAAPRVLMGLDNLERSRN